MVAKPIQADAVTINLEQQAIQDKLSRFIEDFNNLNMSKVAAHFAEEATLFPRTVMTDRATSKVVLDEYCREEGPGNFQSLENFSAELRAESAGPPYMDLEPLETKIQVFGETAIVTFHLRNPERLGRRTFVYVKRHYEWKIIHLHASNVELSR